MWLVLSAVMRKFLSLSLAAVGILAAVASAQSTGVRFSGRLIVLDDSIRALRSADGGLETQVLASVAVSGMVAPDRTALAYLDGKAWLHIVDLIKGTTRRFDVQSPRPMAWCDDSSGILFRDGRSLHFASRSGKVSKLWTTTISSIYRDRPSDKPVRAFADFEFERCDSAGVVFSHTVKMPLVFEVPREAAIFGLEQYFVDGTQATSRIGTDGRGLTSIQQEESFKWTASLSRNDIGRFKACGLPASSPLTLFRGRPVMRHAALLIDSCLVAGIVDALESGSAPNKTERVLMVFKFNNGSWREVERYTAAGIADQVQWIGTGEERVVAWRAVDLSSGRIVSELKIRDLRTGQEISSKSAEIVDWIR
jgi:hypothetical protein